MSRCYAIDDIRPQTGTLDAIGVAFSAVANPAGSLGAATSVAAAHTFDQAVSYADSAAHNGLTCFQYAGLGAFCCVTKLAIDSRARARTIATPITRRFGGGLLAPVILATSPIQTQDRRADEFCMIELSAHRLIASLRG